MRFGAPDAWQQKSALTPCFGGGFLFARTRAAPSPVNWCGASGGGVAVG